MKKTLAVILAMAIVCIASIIAFAAEPISVTVSGYDVSGDVQTYYLNEDGDIVEEKTEATQLILKNKGSFYCNGVLVEAGSNGKASLVMPLPVEYVVPTQKTTEETTTELEEPTTEVPAKIGKTEEETTVPEETTIVVEETTEETIEETITEIKETPVVVPKVEITTEETTEDVYYMELPELPTSYVFEEVATPVETEETEAIEVVIPDVTIPDITIPTVDIEKVEDVINDVAKIGKKHIKSAYAGSYTEETTEETTEVETEAETVEVEEIPNTGSNAFIGIAALLALMSAIVVIIKKK